ncbi:nicotinamide-nucleotide amidase [Candidatus Methylocalor cossyra]|uniref:NMN aminohydrolase n=1 Tax=Candidatus Methylocalor cossyra TaxID=3108543 RepID=A0ABP1C5N2_9GAMM
MNDDDLYALARRVGHCLAAAGLRLVTAESCTGGWIAQCITDVAGSSGWFDRGFVTYSNEAKTELLGVAEDLLRDFGAVSEAVVRAMAAGALRHSQAQVAVAVSGVAGPSGGTLEKPVGTVWFAWQRLGRDCRVVRHLLEGDRRAVRRQAVAIALRGIVDAGRD